VSPPPVTGSTTAVNPRVEPTPRAPSSPPPPGPRTTVVDRSRPRTVVVDRNRPVTEGPPSGLLPASTSASVPSAGAETHITLPAKRESFVDADASGSEGRGRPPKRKSGRATKIPARLLIQTGVVIVIVALLLLKLG
jgi:hypothetical protein